MIARCLVDHANVDEMAGLMRLLGDPTRIRVLGLLQPGEMNVTAICGQLELAQPTVSHHLGLLRTAELLQTRRAGKQIYYSLNPDHLTSSGEGCLHLTFGDVRMCMGTESCESEPLSHAAAVPRPAASPGTVN